MPEGQAIHRLAAVINEQLTGSCVQASSPQGRFSVGASQIDGLMAGQAQAWGKHFFLPFTNFSANPSEVFPPSLEHVSRFPRVLWLHVHLGLYGRWFFAGPRAQEVKGPGIRLRHHAINVGKSDADKPGKSEGDNPGTSEKDKPGSTVRLRLVVDGLVVDLTGPHRCQIFSSEEVERKILSLGPDPIRNNPGDRERFIAAVRRRRVPVGQLVMDQSVAAGPGNIYRADCLWRVGISPFCPGNQVSEERLGSLWDDLSTAMRHDVSDGVIRTVPPEFKPLKVSQEDPELERFVAYHRTGRPCPRCGTSIAEEDMAGRRLFWCPGCQR